jgi:hypothetical protein
MRCYFRIVLVVALAFAPLCAHADNVLLLGDGEAELEVQPALEAAGHTVTFGGIYYDWDGITPNVDDFDVVVLLDGYDYGYELQPDAATALDSFVAGGCGLVTTEWIAYDVCQAYKGPIVGGLLPVTMPDCGDYGDIDTWIVDDPAHPLTAGLPANWRDDAGWSTVTANPGATTVVSGAAGNPLVVYSDAAGGTVVYLNHDMTYTLAPIHPNAMQLILNAVDYASCAFQPPPAQIPTVSPWGAALMVLVLVAIGLWVVRRSAA